MNEKQFLNLLKNHNQTHILDHYNNLDPEQRRIFLTESIGLDIPLVFDLYGDSIKRDHSLKQTHNIAPAHIITIPKTTNELETQQSARLLGEALIRDNKIAVLIVAGGQGSRLGYDGPKGMFPISPIKSKSFFQIFAESVKALSKKYNAVIPLLIMTSPENNKTTEDFFRNNKFFGLGHDTVRLFAQEAIPSVTPEGKLILKDKTHLFTNPNGHGGSLKSLHDSGILKSLMERGYSDIFYCQVDNPLVKIADPVFIGHHKNQNAKISTKVVHRKTCEEKMGLFVVEDGKSEIIEYSDLDLGNRCILDEKGRMRDWAGNTAIHIISLPFIEKLNKKGFALPYHRAIKTVDTIDSDDKQVKTTAWKFETFVFDAIPLADKTCCMEVTRDEEFAPVKNKEGEDSPETVKTAITSLYRSWLKEAGIKIPHDARVEICPLFALNKEELIGKISGRIINIGGTIYLE